MTDNELFTEDNDSSISVAEVASYLASAAEDQSSTSVEIPEDIKAMLSAKSEDSEEAPNPRIELPVDETFAHNNKNLFDKMVVNVQDVEVPITEEDKAMYLKCVLHSLPVELTVSAPNGISGKCRSLSVYEGDVIATAFARFVAACPDLALGFHDGIIQQYRIAMQLMQFCGKPCEYLEYKRGVNGTLADHADDLIEKSKVVLDVAAPVYDIYVRIMNVYHYKLSRLNSAAFNSDFWSPVGSD
jgi:hypothetical protein